MSETLINLFRQFHLDAIDKQFSPSIRTLYYHLLGQWNERRRPAKFIVNHSAERALCGLETTAYYGSFSKLVELGYIHSKRLKKNICEVSMGGVQTTPIINDTKKTFKQSSERAREVEVKKPAPQSFSASTWAMCDAVLSKIRKEDES